MKKIMFILMMSIVMFMTSCTSNVRSRIYGGDSTIHVDKGYKVIEVTWKENNLWYLIEPMEDDYVPKTKIFKEDSNFGVIQGSVTFIESK